MEDVGLSILDIAKSELRGLASRITEARAAEVDGENARR